MANDAGTAAIATPLGDGADPGLAALTAALEQARAAQAHNTAAGTGAAQATSAGPVDATFFGLTMAALCAGFVLSAIGVGFVVYAKSEAHPLFAIFGIALFIVPFVLTSTVPLVVVGTVLVVLPMLLLRYLHW